MMITGLIALFVGVYKRRKKLMAMILIVALTGVLMMLLRKVFHFSRGYKFLLWNFFLASISPIMSSLMLEMKHLNYKPWKIALIACIWLLFLPNGPYMLTDYKYIWFDYEGNIYPNIASISWFAIPALFLTLISMNDVSLLLALKLHKAWVTLALAGICLLTGFGVFIGGIMRFNSWDILHHPFHLFCEIARYFLHPVTDRNPWVITISYGSMLFLMLMVLKTVAREFSATGSER